MNDGNIITTLAERWWLKGTNPIPVGRVGDAGTASTWGLASSASRRNKTRKVPASWYLIYHEIEVSHLHQHINTPRRPANPAL